MKNNKVLKMVVAALLAALVYVATSIVKIPSPTGGYTNLGDCFVLVAGWILGPVWGGLAAGVGSALTDLLGGYTHYVPGTFVIKGLDAAVAAIVFSKMKKGLPAMITSGIIGETIMVLGYFGYASLILGKGFGAAASIPGNIIQGVIGIVAGTAIMLIVQKTRVTDSLQ